MVVCLWAERKKETRTIVGEYRRMYEMRYRNRVDTAGGQFRTKGWKSVGRVAGIVYLCSVFKETIVHLKRKHIRSICKGCTYCH